MTGVMRRFSAALAAAAMAVSIVPFADISAYAEYAATHPEGFVYNVPLVKTQMKKIIVTAKTLYSHPKNVSKIYAALHTDLAW